MSQRAQFPLFQSHLDLAHAYWRQIVQRGDQVIDATCGNGQDTLVLCQLALGNSTGLVCAIDIQPKAIELTRRYLSENLPSHLIENIYPPHGIYYSQGCHSQFPSFIQPATVALIVYNLGYLPGSDKNLTTQTATTLQSLKRALGLVKAGGAISLTCYPGHAEGAIEQNAILEFASALPPTEWNCCHHQWLNRKKSPSLLLLQKKTIHHI